MPGETREFIVARARVGNGNPCAVYLIDAEDAKEFKAGWPTTSRPTPATWPKSAACRSSATPTCWAPCSRSRCRPPRPARTRALVGLLLRRRRPRPVAAGFAVGYAVETHRAELACLFMAAPFSQNTACVVRRAAFSPALKSATCGLTCLLPECYAVNGVHRFGPIRP